MRKKKHLLILSIVSLLAILIAISQGSVSIPLLATAKVFLNKLFSMKLPEDFAQVYVDLVWSIRFPRVILAFLIGGSMAISGTIMQSVLKNPLASSYGLGVSSGAGVGCAILMILGLSTGAFSYIFMPIVALVCSFITVAIVLFFSNQISSRVENQTIILVGIVLSFFFNAILSYIASSNPKYSQQIILWQLGSFAMKEWLYIWILIISLIPILLLLTIHSRQLDVLTFGEEQALSLGVDIKKAKLLFIIASTLLTGLTVAFVGIIGFVDLIAPHITRRVFGSSHKLLIPASALFGGTFMVFCDLLGRTLASPSEIPVGTITALFGAPFFIYIFFRTSQENRL